ncbi:class I SAM-dependent methyltransferase [Algoriphagus halophytocola]|uniref:Class I SAM-dependent methyltransferase n=1 Tax=Algoriphagus halophytocola TaxID=2991499 RepID=A0ABY6MP91_9BACT|nr:MULTISPECIES: class I SAM-dependent methyltransferase [unclassified Algoriphagus]UZD24146.1 class I SAM-dependent methyltransferase [Algoriphagus sp. TR-M5]WBL41517.1 class I SAM-dependent methyltransferase [Algoriphagus sp. TR-M9]
MNQNTNISKPEVYDTLLKKSEQNGFTMPSDLYIGTLLKSLVASKPCGNFLELGTGMGLSLAWMVAGMDDCGSVISIDNDPSLCRIVQQHFNLDSRVNILCQDGSEWIKNYSGDQFDLIFADAWPGKYSELDETLALLKPGGFYVIDDMDEQPNWPEGHAERAEELIKVLEAKSGFSCTKMNWSTGVILLCKMN